MVVALVQLYLFLRTPAVDAGGKCKLHTTEQEQCKHRKRRGEKVIPAAVGQKKQTEQEKQGIENREQGSDQRMNDNELVTHISRSHGGDVGAPDGIHRLCFFEFLKLQLQRLCGDFLFRACKTEFFLAVEILTADFSNNPSPYCVSRKTTTVYRQARYDFASSKFKNSRREKQGEIRQRCSCKSASEKPEQHAVIALAHHS